MAAAKHERSGPVERIEQFYRLQAGCRGSERQRDQQHEEDRQHEGARRATHRERQGGMLSLRRSFQQHHPDQPSQRNGADLAPCARHRQHQDCSRHGDAGALAIGRERAHHAEHGLRHDGDGGDLEPVQPGRPACASQGAHAIREENHRERGRQRKTGPGGKSAEVAGAGQANGDADLTRGRAGQKLTERHEIGIGAIVQPTPAHDELVAEIPEMGDWTAERRQPESQKSQQHLAPAAGRPDLRGRHRELAHAGVALR